MSKADIERIALSIRARVVEDVTADIGWASKGLGVLIDIDGTIDLLED